MGVERRGPWWSAAEAAKALRFQREQEALRIVEDRKEIRKNRFILAMLIIGIVLLIMRICAYM